jgi:predicted ribonuclease YlaK
MNGVLNRECQTLDRRLQRLTQELEGQREFISRPGRPVILDTSALMQGLFFLEFDWHGLHTLLADQAVRLIVPSLVIEELDGHNRSRDRRVRTDARQVLRTMWDLHRAASSRPSLLPGATDVTIEVYLDSDWHKRRENNDGEIIDQAVAVGELTGQPAILASCDYTQLYRAGNVGLNAIEMPRRPDEP